MTILFALLAVVQTADVPVVLLGNAASLKNGQHDYPSGVDFLAGALKETPGVRTAVVKDGWPSDPSVFDGARCVVFYMDGGGKQPTADPGRLSVLEGLAAKGVGIVHLHQMVDYPKPVADRARALLGGVWIKGAGARGHWDGDFRAFPDHPITRGVSPFKENDGYLYRISFVDGLHGVTPLLRTMPPKAALQGTEDIVAWAYERPAGGRSFVFTGVHEHKLWSVDGLRRFTLNGILWAAGLLSN
ncbi:MAG TPA: ThuA domain-containing protein [Planctomycetota bacterium]|nr:ThuA domain-containing protein [Planctomycetota bacterium]